MNPISLHGDADDHGRISQLGQGQQYNIDKAYIWSAGPLAAIIEHTAHRALVREWDPIQLGVHRTTILQGNAVPNYIDRDIDDELRRRVAEAVAGGLILIVGDSTAGKSRAAYEALLAVTPDHELFIPNDSLPFQSILLPLLSTRERRILWLDDLERYLSTDGLTAGLLNQMQQAGVLIVSTLRSEYYRRYRQANPDSGRTGLRDLDSIWNSFDPIILPRIWSDTERNRAAESEDQRVVDAVPHGETYGLAEYLAAGPRLLEEYQLAGEGGGNPRGAAIIAAAIDCTRAGLRRAVPADLLRIMHQPYLERMGGAALRPESFENAMAWATRKRYGITSLLVPVKAGRYRVFDYLPDALERKGALADLPDETWSAIADFVEDNRHRSLAVALSAAQNDRYDIAERLLGRLGAGGDSAALLILGLMMEHQDRASDALKWVRRSADAGNADAAVWLGDRYAAEGDHSSAETWFTLAAKGRNVNGVMKLANLLEGQKRIDEAIEWFRVGAELKAYAATGSLGHLLAQAGHRDEAIELLQGAAADDDLAALNALGIVYAEADQDLDAEAAWRSAADAGDEVAMANLALYYRRKGKLFDAELWARRAVDAGSDDTVGLLGSILLDLGRQREGETALRAASDSGDADASHRLGVHLGKRGKSLEAEKYLRLAVTADEAGAAASLADHLERSGRSEEAADYWSRADAEGDEAAITLRGRLRKEAGDLYGAEQLFRDGAARGDATAACELGRMLLTRDEDEGLEWLEQSAAQGHAHASCVLGSIFYDDDALGEAVSAWTKAYEGGHLHVLEYLVATLRTLGRDDEAASWLKRTQNHQHKRRKSKPKKRRRNRPKR